MKTIKIWAKGSPKPATTLVKRVGTQMESSYRLKKLSHNTTTNSSKAGTPLRRPLLPGPVGGRHRGVRLYIYIMHYFEA